METELTHGDLHVFFRGVSRALGEVEYTSMYDAISKVVWTMGVGETDRDPLFLFDDYDLAAVYRMVHASRGYDEAAGKVIEYRVFNVFDHEANLMETVTMERVREIEDGELE
jgi:hypothetical protein